MSLELSSLCVLDPAGKPIREAKVPSEPEALVAFLSGLGLPIGRVGLEAGPLSQWLYDGLQKASFEVILVETRHVKAALSAMAIKTDRRDARGIAQLLRMGWSGIGPITASAIVATVTDLTQFHSASSSRPGLGSCPSRTAAAAKNVRAASPSKEISTCDGFSFWARHL